MKRILIVSSCALCLAAPAFADAEAFGASKGPFTSTAAATDMAVEKLSGSDLDERISLGSNEIATSGSQGITQGHLRLAAEMGVDARDFTIAELTKMYIGEYN